MYNSFLCGYAWFFSVSVKTFYTYYGRQPLRRLFPIPACWYLMLLYHFLFWVWAKLSDSLPIWLIEYWENYRMPFQYQVAKTMLLLPWLPPAPLLRGDFPPGRDDREDALSSFLISVMHSLKSLQQWALCWSLLCVTCFHQSLILWSIHGR